MCNLCAKLHEESRDIEPKVYKEFGDWFHDDGHGRSACRDPESLAWGGNPSVFEDYERDELAKNIVKIACLIAAILALVVAWRKIMRGMTLYYR